METGLVGRIISKLRGKGGEVLNSVIDNDVAKEQKRVKSLLNDTFADQAQDSLLVADLKKSFGSLQAVKGLTFGVKHGECFGLLGINGAGKTTTFR